MTSPFVVVCSNCSGKLKLKDQSMIGKKVRCPKCSEPFLIEAPQKKKSLPTPADDGGFYDEPEDDFGSPEDDWDDSFDEPVRPGKRKSKSAKSSQSRNKKRQKKKNSKSVIPLGMIFVMIGGGIAFLSLIGVGFVYLLPMLAGNSANRMQWLPNDTKVYVEIKVSEIWKSQVLKPLRTSKVGEEMVKKMKDQGDLAMEDIEKIIVGMPANNAKPIVIIYSTKTIDPNKLGNEMQKATYAGKTIYESTNEDAAGFLLDSKTIVAGPKEMIHAAIDRKGECAVADQFKFLPTSGDIIFGTLSPGDALKNSPAAMISHSAFDPQQMKTLSGVLKLDSNLTVNLTADFNDSAAAQASLKQAQEGRDKALEALEKQQTQLEAGNFLINRQQKSIVLKATEVMRSVSFKESGTEMITSLKISGSTIEDIVGMFGEQSGGFMPGIGGGLGNPF